jgi:hypothetical protein
MGIRFLCPNGHKLNVKSFLAGKRAICPQCGVKVLVPNQAEPTTEPSRTADGTVPNPLAAAGQLANQRLMDTASPSVMIAMAESEVAPVRQGAATSIPESIAVAPTQPVAPVTPIAMPPDAAYNLRRERNRRNQVKIAVALALTVIVLAIVLIWVLRRNASPTPASPQGSTRVSASAPLVPAMIAAGVPSHGNNSRE